MPPLDTEAQFKFLLCCIKHSAAGKVNFDAVSKELNIVTKAAAAKRYERLLKAHDISTNNSPRKAAGAGRNNADSDSLDGSEASPKTPVSKKRKRAGGASASRAASTVKHDDDEEDETPVKKERAVKKERVPKKEESDEDAKVKGEDDGDDFDSV